MPNSSASKSSRLRCLANAWPSARVLEARTRDCQKIASRYLIPYVSLRQSDLALEGTSTGRGYKKFDGVSGALNEWGGVRRTACPHRGSVLSAGYLVFGPVFLDRTSAACARVQPWISQPPHFFGFFQGAPGSSAIMRVKIVAVAWSLSQA